MPGQPLANMGFNADWHVDLFHFGTGAPTSAGLQWPGNGQSSLPLSGTYL